MCVAVVFALNYWLDAEWLPGFIKLPVMDRYVSAQSASDKVDLNKLPDQRYLLGKRKLVWQRKMDGACQLSVFSPFRVIEGIQQCLPVQKLRRCFWRQQNFFIYHILTVGAIMNQTVIHVA